VGDCGFEDPALPRKRLDNGSIEVLRIELKAVSMVLVLMLLGGCGADATAPEVESGAALVSVVPAHGAVDVSVGTTVVMTFDHPLASGMEQYAALHEGGLEGPLVDGLWVLSSAGTVLTFTPAGELKAATTYTIHLGAGMMDARGHLVDLEQHGLGMGGAWATRSMMTGGGMMGGGTMGGGVMGSMMGEGWAHPTNDTFGMLFTFITDG
jgi:hypothetical protein